MGSVRKLDLQESVEEMKASLECKEKPAEEKAAKKAMKKKILQNEAKKKKTVQRKDAADKAAADKAAADDATAKWAEEKKRIKKAAAEKVRLGTLCKGVVTHTWWSSMHRSQYNLRRQDPAMLVAEARHTVETE